MRDGCRTPVGWLGWLVICSVLLAATACTREADRTPLVQVEGGNPARGEQALFTYGCTSCHTIPGVDNANATVGPPLDDWADRWYIAGLLENEPNNLIHWIQAPQSIKPGVAMPNMGVTTSDARDIAAYLYTLHRDR